MTEHDFAFRFRYSTEDDKFAWLLIPVQATIPLLSETIKRLVADVIKQYPDACFDGMTMTFGSRQD